MMSSRPPAADATLEQKRRQIARLLLQRHRQSFPALDPLTYLNFGVQGPLAAQAAQASAASLARIDELAPYSTDALLERREELAAARAALALELATEPANVALVENTSVAMNIVLWGLRWRAGDRIVLTTHEYPGLMAAVRQLARRLQLKVVEWSIDGPDEDVLTALEPLLEPPTRLLVVSHIPWDTGRVLPLAEIAQRCRRRPGSPVRLLVDGAQAVGVLPLAAQDGGSGSPASGAPPSSGSLALGSSAVDYYAFTGHKWWCGPEGAGGLYVADAALGDLEPTFVGPRSLDFRGADGFGELRSDAARFEVSSAAVGLHSALVASLKAHASWGDSASRYRRLRELSERAWRGLGELKDGGVERLQTEPPEAGLIFFRVRHREPLEVARFLEARGVLIRTIPHAHCLRVSTHYLTLEEEVDELLTQLADLLQRPPSLGAHHG